MPRDPAVTAARTRHLVAALVTIALGLLVHRRGTMLGPAVRDVAGDALWAAMIVWWVSALAPATRRRWRGAAAYAVCAAVEAAQLLHTPRLDAVRATTLGHLVLGSAFDVRDLFAYAAGVAAALLLDRAFVARGQSERVPFVRAISACRPPRRPGTPGAGTRSSRQTPS